MQNYSAKDVWFDDVRVVTVEEMVVQENHYDPWGQNLVDLETTGKPEHLGQYTGKERQREGGLEWADFGARHYDAQLGRWHAQDPAAQYNSPYLAMGNSPVVNVDPDGRFAFVPLLIGAAVGAYAGYQVGGWKGAGIGLLIGAASGGAAIGISAAGGGAIMAGAGAGAVSGAGFAGLNSNWDMGAMGRGAVIGSISGGIGGGIGQAVAIQSASGGLGAFASGVSADAAGQLTNMAFDSDAGFNPLQSLLAGGATFGMYHGASALNYLAHVRNNPAFNPDGHHTTYRQYKQFDKMYLMSKRDHLEYALHLKDEGVFHIVRGEPRSVDATPESGDWGFAHTHWNPETTVGISGQHSPTENFTGYRMSYVRAFDGATYWPAGMARPGSVNANANIQQPYGLSFGWNNPFFMNFIFP